MGKVIRTLMVICFGSLAPILNAMECKYVLAPRTKSHLSQTKIKSDIAKDQIRELKARYDNLLYLSGTFLELQPIALLENTAPLFNLLSFSAHKRGIHSAELMTDLFVSAKTLELEANVKSFYEMSLKSDSFEKFLENLSPSVYEGIPHKEHFQEHKENYLRYLSVKSRLNGESLLEPSKYLREYSILDKEMLAVMNSRSENVLDSLRIPITGQMNRISVYPFLNMLKIAVLDLKDSKAYFDYLKYKSGSEDMALKSYTSSMISLLHFLRAPSFYDNFYAVPNLGFKTIEAKQYFTGVTGAGSPHRQVLVGQFEKYNAQNIIFFEAIQQSIKETQGFLGKSSLGSNKLWQELVAEKELTQEYISSKGLSSLKISRTSKKGINFKFGNIEFYFGKDWMQFRHEKIRHGNYFLVALSNARVRNLDEAKDLLITVQALNILAYAELNSYEVFYATKSGHHKQKFSVLDVAMSLSTFSNNLEFNARKDSDRETLETIISGYANFKNLQKQIAEKAEQKN